MTRRPTAGGFHQYLQTGQKALRREPTGGTHHVGSFVTDVLLTTTTTTSITVTVTATITVVRCVLASVAIIVIIIIVLLFHTPVIIACCSVILR